MAEKQRHILVVSHTGREDALTAGAAVAARLIKAGVSVVVPDGERDRLVAHREGLERVQVLGTDVAATDVELAIILGGDGTILRAAELVRGQSTPLLGVNLGHIGFLAELERDDLAAAVDRVLEGDYAVEERTTLSVTVYDGAEAIYSSWALNEASIEKGSRERMIDIATEVDGQPLASYGCDGIVLSTSTGSTAYSFSAGGPVVWPDLDVLLVVPLSAHALFARPLVVSPHSSFAVELHEHSATASVLWCDGRRAIDLPAGARVVVTGSDTPVRLARLHPGAFAKRLVRKFDLNVAGWRGPRT